MADAFLTAIEARGALLNDRTMRPSIETIVSIVLFSVGVSSEQNLWKQYLLFV